MATQSTYLKVTSVSSEASHMMRHEKLDTAPARRNGGARQWRCDPSYLAELVEVLVRHPAGLRRWSVMRAMRTARADRDVPLKFEDEVERTFRQYCANCDTPKVPDPAPQDALFFKPADKAGEVWAVFPDRATEWLARNKPSE
jgi:hypothetical protein